MEYQNLTVSVEDGIGWVKMNRPKAMNALNTATLKELGQAFKDFRHDSDVKVIILTGEGKAFVAGADIAEMSDMTAFHARHFSKMGQVVFDRIENMEKPVIAAINGFALGGGCELAMACDIRLASTKAKLGQPEVNLGLIPGFAGTQRLSRLCGSAIAKELIFTGDMIDAETAKSIGLINHVYEPDQLLEEAKNMALKIAAKGPTAVRLAKTAINRGLDSNFQTGSAFESEAFGVCCAGTEHKEGMSAFLEKRKPNW